MNQPIRIYEGSTKPHEPFWRVRDADVSESGEPEIEFYGFISEYSWFDDDITPKMFKDALYGTGKGGPVTVRMNSGGGEVFAASVIKSLLVEYPGRVTVRIDGLAASAATIVALGGDVVKMQDSAYFMIHDPSIMAWGTIETIKQALDLLKTIKDGIIEGYTNRTKLAGEKLARMMTDETWMTAKQALEFGFIDEIIVNKDKEAMNVPGAGSILNALRNYQHVPPDLIASYQAGEAEADAPVSAPAESGEVESLRAYLNIFG